MASLSRALICIFVVSVAASNSDNSNLVQSSLERRGKRAPPAPIPTPAPTNATDAPTPAPTPPPHIALYRLNFKKTWGDDHVCLTEITFYDQINEVLPAEFIDTSTCWGCAVSCRNCTVDYGNPLVLFDGVSNQDSAQSYFCTDFASFSGLGDNGNEMITFRLRTRPHHYTLGRADTKGTAIPKGLALEELQLDDSWMVISSSDEVPIEINQTLDVEPIAGPAGRWWEYEDPECMSDMKLPAPIQEPLSVQYSTVDMAEGKYQNNGYAIFMDGELGVLWIDDVKYYCKHWHIKFPSQRVMGEAQTPIIGEIHIVHQKSDGRATSHLHQDGLAIVVIPLVLPLEGSPMTKSQVWFDENFGTLPVDGASKPLPSNFSLNVFKEQLNGSYYELPAPCQERNEDGSYNPKKPIWFLLEKPAVITGKNVQGFKDMFPYDVAGPGSYNRTYLVDGVIETVSYDSFGREHLMGVSTPKIEAEPPSMNFTDIPGMHWKANPAYLEGFGQFMPMGEWWFPPDAIDVIQEQVATNLATAELGSGGVTQLS